VTFDRYASEYDAHLEKGIKLSGEGREFFALGRLEAVKAFLAGAQIQPQRVLEFGCGTGANLAVIRDLWPGAEVAGVDTSRESLAVARARLSSRSVRLLSAEEWVEGAAGGFDWVFCNGVFHHIAPADQDAAVTFVRGCLRPGGLFTLFDNNPFNPGTHLVMRRIPFDRDARMINPYRLQTRLRRLGFERVSCRFLFVFPRPFSALRRLERPLERWPFGAQYGIFAFRAAQGTSTHVRGTARGRNEAQAVVAVRRRFAVSIAAARAMLTIAQGVTK
jgi:SAM-dependent methyltransferase